MHFNSFKDFDFAVKSIFDDERDLPFRITFDSPDDVKGYLKTPVLQIDVAMKRTDFTDGRERLVMTSELFKENLFADVLPIQKIISIVVHPDFVRRDKTVFTGPFLTQQLFDNEIKDLVGEDEFIDVCFTFSEKVFIPKFNPLPSNMLKIVTTVSTLKKHGTSHWEKYVCLYLKRKSKYYYFSTILPFEKCIGIAPAELIPQHIMITSSKAAGSKTIKLSAPVPSPSTGTNVPDKKYTGPEKNKNNALNSKFGPLFQSTPARAQQQMPSLPEGQVSLFEIISKSAVKAKTRDASHCIICGREVKREESEFVHLLTNGNLINTASIQSDELEFGFFPIGPDCKKKFADEYSFSVEEVKRSIEQVIIPAGSNPEEFKTSLIDVPSERV